MTNSVEKTASIYEEAYLNLAYEDAVEKVASIYGGDLPPEYQEVLVKEALLATLAKAPKAIGTAAAKGLSRLGAKLRGSGRQATGLKGLQQRAGNAAFDAGGHVGRNATAYGAGALGAAGATAAGGAGLIGYRALKK